MKLFEVERRQEGSKTKESAEGDDVDEIEGPTVFLPKTAQMLSKTLVLHVGRFLREEYHYAQRQKHEEGRESVDMLPSEMLCEPRSKERRDSGPAVPCSGNAHGEPLVLLRKPACAER